MATALALLPETPLPSTLGLPTTGWRGGGLVFLAWGAAAVVALCGLVLLLWPRFGRPVTLGLGLVSIVASLYVVTGLMGRESLGYVLASSFSLAPAVAQVVIGLLLPRRGK